MYGKHKIYILSVSPGRFFKVGVTKRTVEWRRDELQSGCPIRIKIEYQRCTELALKIERRVKVDFSEQRVRGEWFKLTKNQEIKLRQLLESFEG